MSARAASCCLIALLAACNQAPPSDQQVQAALQLIQQLKWDEAIPLLKQRLLDAPEDAAAHFNLGRCYLNAPQPCLGVASGEFEVALTLFLQQGRKSPIKEFGDEYFELRCYLEIAKTYLRSYQIAQTLRADPAVLNRILDQCRRIAEAARRVTPDAPEIQQLDDILDALPRAV